MKYVLLVHSNPRPWGHPTGDFNAEYQALPAEQREQMEREFWTFLDQLRADGELLSGEALGDPAAARLFRWDAGPVVTDGPYSETREHLAGFFLIDVADAERAEYVASRFASPGDTIELRPAMWPGGEDQ